MSHIETSLLALYAGGDLPFHRRWFVSLHLGRCDRCRGKVAEFRREREWFQDAGDELPGGVRWDRLAGEMKANIQVGLAAGECVSQAEPEPKPQRLGWRTAAALASITVVVVSGWWLHMPTPSRVASSFDPGDVVLEATADGIEVRQQGESGMTLLHAAQPVMVSVSVEGSMAARFVDDETGMVTINNVYAQ